MSVESPRGLRAVLREVYSCPPISEPEYYSPKPSKESGGYKERSIDSVAQGNGVKISLFLSKINVCI